MKADGNRVGVERTLRVGGRRFTVEISEEIDASASAGESVEICLSALIAAASELERQVSPDAPSKVADNMRAELKRLLDNPAGPPAT